MSAVTQTDTNSVLSVGLAVVGLLGVAGAVIPPATLAEVLPIYRVSSVSAEQLPISASSIVSSASSDALENMPSADAETGQAITAVAVRVSESAQPVVDASATIAKPLTPTQNVTPDSSIPDSLTQETPEIDSLDGSSAGSVMLDASDNMVEVASPVLNGNPASTELPVAPTEVSGKTVAEADQAAGAQQTPEASTDQNTASTELASTDAAVTSPTTETMVQAAKPHRSPSMPTPPARTVPVLRPQPYRAMQPVNVLTPWGWQQHPVSAQPPAQPSQYLFPQPVFVRPVFPQPPHWVTHPQVTRQQSK